MRSIRFCRMVAIAMLCLFVCSLLGLSAQAAPAPTKSRAQLATVAQSAVLMDGNGTVLFEKEAHKQLPPASVTKVMTILLAVEAIEQGKVKLTDQITTSETASKQGGSQIWLEPGETMTMHEMLIALAVVSANDAAVAIMEHIYGSQQAAVDAMNRKAQELGLKNTNFVNVNGLPAVGHYMSAYDTAMIVKEAVGHPLYMEVCSIKEYWLRGGKNWLVNTNKLLWWYKGADGLKTGWTEDAKYCFAGTAKRDGLRLISVVFAAPEPRSHLRESMKLMDWGFANYAAIPVVEHGVVVDRVKVSKGQQGEIELVAANELSLLVGKGDGKNLQKKITVDPVIVAPVIQGQKYGELIVFKDGQEVGKVDLVAQKTIERAGFLQIFQNMFHQFFSV